jgi:EF hand
MRTPEFSLCARHGTRHYRIPKVRCHARATLIGIAPAWSQSLLKTLDPDNDGTVLTEAKTAAGKLFDKLELRGSLNGKDFAAADPYNDGTVDKTEFLAIVEKHFKAADPDNDGTIDAKEFRSAAGRSLVRLLN